MIRTLVFSIVWTIAATAMCIALALEPEFAKQSLLYRVIMTSLPVFGIWFVWRSWRERRRYLSVQTLKTEDGDVFTWTDLNGRVRRAFVDPRIKWDEEDRMEGG